MSEPLVVAVSDSELLERVHAGDDAAREHLLDRHRAAAAILPELAPYFSVEASGRAALWWAPEPGGPRLPFRLVWLALRAQGAVPTQAPEKHAATWAAYVALAAPERLAVWHQEVEGQQGHEIGRHLGLGEARATALLARATAELVDALGEQAVRGIRTALAEVVLGPLSTDYLARRPRVIHLAPPVRRAGRRAPLAVMGAGLASFAMLVALLVPGGGPAPDRGPGLAAPSLGAALQEVRPGVALRQSVPSSALAPAPRRSAPTGGGTGADGSGGSGMPPQPPSSEPGPGAPEQAPNEPGPVDVTVTPEGVRVAVDPGVADPVVVDIPLPVVPGLG
jgi:DNA-directed RNA polymerase specialized sigma24 family protein